MPINVARLKARTATGYARAFGGRMSRATFALRAAILIGVMCITIAPVSTILSPSTKTLRDAYGLAAFILTLFCLVGFVSAYVRRLHDIGLRGYWALVALILLPLAIFAGGIEYNDYRWNLDHAYDTAELGSVLGFLALIPTIMFAMWRGEKPQTGSAPSPRRSSMHLHPVSASLRWLRLRVSSCPPPFTLGFSNRGFG